MGCGLSCRSSTSTFDGVRVVHINGYVEDFPGPVSVAEVTGKPPKLLCFSPVQLLSFAARPLGLDERLEPGRLYFLLPQSILQSDSSPVDLAALATRLTALARSGGGAAAPIAPPTSKLPFPCVSEFNSAPVGHHAHAGSRYDYAMGDGLGRRGASTKFRAWKPILDTIEESFRRSMIDERSVGRSTRHGMSSRSSSTYSRLVGEEERPSS